jgi:hypothetical protein
LIRKESKIFVLEISGKPFWAVSEVPTSFFSSNFEVNLNFGPIEKPKVSEFPEEILLLIAEYLKTPLFG